jgi:hypothetical protein
VTDALQSFKGHSYLNLETRKRNGTTVPTPVWFVADGPSLYVRTEVTSGKAKRVRNDPRVRIAPCAANGDLRGEWQPAHASHVEGQEAARIRQLFLRKYGFPLFGFELMLRLRGKGWATIAVTPDG